MKNIFWIAAIFLAFIAGYLFRGVNQVTPTIEKVTQPAQLAGTTEASQISSEKLSAATKTVFAAKEGIPAKPEHQASQQSNTEKTTALEPQIATNPTATDTNNPTAKKYPNEISEEEIDKVLPAPFNKALKNNHGYLREKYKEFAESNQPSDWDKEMQNKLSDSISGSPYAKFINLESIQCKVNLCEIRLYETKEGAWPLIMAEMRLQDWWGFGGTSASGISTNTPGTMGWYILFPRR